MKAISIRQPWANAVIHGSKNIENRSWTTSLRGPVAIHAGATLHKQSAEDYIRFVHERRLPEDAQMTISEMRMLPLGVVIGVVNVVDCVTRSDSPWFEGPHGFVLSRPVPVEPIPCRGALQFFDLPLSVEREIERQLDVLRYRPL